MQNSFDIIEMKYETAKGQILQQENESKEKESLIKKLNEQIDSLKDQQRKKQKKIEELTLDINVKSEILKVRDQNIIKLKQQIREQDDWFKDQLTEKTTSQITQNHLAKIESLQKEVLDLKEGKIQLEEQLKQRVDVGSGEESQELQKRLEIKEQELGKEKERKMELEKENKRVSKNNEQKNVEIKNLSKKLEEVKQENNALQQEMNELLKIRNNVIF